MSDRFEEMMDSFLVPVNRLDQVSDCLYLLRRDGSFVFTHGYRHPPGAAWGMIIKYPDPKGHLDIFGRSYNWTHRKVVDGQLAIVPYPEQRRRQLEIALDLDPDAVGPPFAEHMVSFPLDSLAGFFDPLRSLELLKKRSARLEESVDRAAELLRLKSEKLGATGSLAYGHFQEPIDDVDLIIHGSVEENLRVARRIRHLVEENPELEVRELGKVWPLRFQLDGVIICPFFKYLDRSEIPLPDCHMVALRPVSATGVVVDDTHTLYTPAVVRLAGVSFDDGEHPDREVDLIMYNSALRGELFEGDTVQIRGRLVDLVGDQDTTTAILVTDGDQAITKL